MFRKSILILLVAGLLVGPSPCCCVVHAATQWAVSLVSSGESISSSSSPACCKTKSGCCSETVATKLDSQVPKHVVAKSFGCCSSLKDCNCRCSQARTAATLNFGSTSISKPSFESIQSFHVLYSTLAPVASKPTSMDRSWSLPTWSGRDCSIQFCRWNC